MPTTRRPRAARPRRREARPQTTTTASPTTSASETPAKTRGSTSGPARRRNSAGIRSFGVASFGEAGQHGGKILPLLDLGDREDERRARAEFGFDAAAQGLGVASPRVRQHGEIQHIGQLSDQINVAQTALEACQPLRGLTAVMRRSLPRRPLDEHNRERLVQLKETLHLVQEKLKN